MGTNSARFEPTAADIAEMSEAHSNGADWQAELDSSVGAAKLATKWGLSKQANPDTVQQKAA